MTSFGYRYDGPPTKCNKGPRSGTVALSEGFEEHFGCGSDGIFNCRPVRVHDSTGKQVATLSFHADGRAWDAHASGELNARIAKFAVLLADELGIQEVISQSHRWDARTRAWADYHGDDPHEEHVHIAQCLAAANSLTIDQVRAAIAAHADLSEEDDMYDPKDRARDDNAAYAVVNLILPAVGRIEQKLASNPGVVSDEDLAKIKAVVEAVNGNISADVAGQVADELAGRLKG